MADNSDVERLTPLDLLMPRAYIPMLMAFRTTESIASVSPRLQRAPATDLPPCTFRMFTIPTTRVNAIKQQLSSYMPRAPTTNTVFFAVLWSAVTRVRMQRNPALATETSKMAIPVNGRRRIGAEFSTPDNPYLGNVVLYALPELLGQGLSTSSAPEALAKICHAIDQSHSPKIDLHHIAEVYSLVDRSEDYRAIGVSWDLLSGRHLAILSWADFGLHGMDFGMGLGLPDFIRVPCGGGAADGLCLLLPRRVPVAADASEEVLELLIVLRREDMHALEQDGIWQSFAN
ncbi:transferase family protein [Hirsutella rhossiliensis]